MTDTLNTTTLPNSDSANIPAKELYTFNDIPVSTMMVICATNLNMNLPVLFEKLEVHATSGLDFKRRPLIRAYVAQNNLPDGTILGVEHEGRVRGIAGKHFRNNMSIIMVVDGRTIRVKIPICGKIQLTGITSDAHSVETMRALWKRIAPLSDAYTFTEDLLGPAPTLRVIVRTMMSNRNFKIGFPVNRRKLNWLINNSYSDIARSIMEESLGYAGVNIKMNYAHDNIEFPVLTWEGDDWVYSSIEYKKLLESLPPKQYAREVSRTYRNTFMVFRSGAVIMSGMNAEHMQDAYATFMRIVSDSRAFIEDIGAHLN